MGRQFQRYWIATSVSMLGSQLSLIAFPLLVLSIGGGVARAGLLATVALVTRLVFRLPAGQIVDRLDRRQLMLVTDAVRFVALASIPLMWATGELTYAHLLVVAATEGVASAVFTPAATVAVRDFVPPDRLTTALSRVQTVSATSALAGPVLGGWLFGFHPVLPFAVDAASYLVSGILILGLPRTRATGPAPEESDRRITAGLRWIGQRPVLARALLFGALINLTGAAAETGVVLVLRADGRSGLVIGLLLGCAGAGAVAGAALAPRIVARLAAGRLFVLVGALWTVGFVVFSVGPPPVVVGVVLVVLMIFTPPSGIALAHGVLSGPRHLLGRISTAVDLGTAGLAAVGPVLVGVSLQAWGASPTWAALGALAGVATLVGAVPLWRTVTLADPPVVREAEVLAHQEPDE